MRRKCWEEGGDDGTFLAVKWSIRTVQAFSCNKLYTTSSFLEQLCLQQIITSTIKTDGTYLPKSSSTSFSPFLHESTTSNHFPLTKVQVVVTSHQTTNFNMKFLNILKMEKKKKKKFFFKQIKHKKSFKWFETYFIYLFIALKKNLLLF